jgi:hypothetical protein
MNISNANAIADFDNEKDRKQISASSLKCNNINVNVNGFSGNEIGTLPTALRNLATNGGTQVSADEGEIGIHSFESERRPSGSDNSPRFVCINNNNNVVVEEPTSPKLLTCKNCFTILSETQIDDLFPIVEPVFQGLVIETLEGLCNLLDGLTRDDDKERLYIILSNALSSTTTITLEETTTILDCLIKLGLIIEP